MNTLIFLVSLMLVQDPEPDWGRQVLGISVAADSNERSVSKLAEHFKVPESQVRNAIGSESVIVQRVQYVVEGFANDLQPFDVIKKIGGNDVAGVNSIPETLAQHAPGTPIELMVLRPAFVESRIQFEEELVQVTPVSFYDLTLAPYDVEIDELTASKIYRQRGCEKDALSIYVVQKDSGEIYQVVRFMCDGWIGLRKVLIKVDGNETEISLTREEQRKNIIADPAYDWFDRPATDMIDLFKSIESAREITVRMSGVDEHQDYDMGMLVQSNIRANRKLIAALKWRASQESAGK